jgi:hypothetical protein
MNENKARKREIRCVAATLGVPKREARVIVDRAASRAAESARDAAERRAAAEREEGQR